MAFTLANWACISTSLNQGQLTVTPFGGSPTLLNAPNLYAYQSPTDSIAQISGANYFLPNYKNLCVGDWIMASGIDASSILIVDTVSSSGVTTSGFAPTGTVNTANIVNNAVTYEKIQQVAAESLLGNPTSGADDVSEIGLGSGLSFNGSDIQVNPALINYVATPVSAADFNGAYAAPKLLVPAAGANTLLVLDKVILALTYDSAAFAAGGTTAVQWSATVNGAGTLASTTLANTAFQVTDSTAFTMNGGVVPAEFASCVNEGLYLSNLSGAFTTGDSDMVAHCWYKVISTV